MKMRMKSKELFCALAVAGTCGAAQAGADGDWAVRFRAAVTMGGGRAFGVSADGVRWQTGGGDYEITVSTNAAAPSAATPGLLGSGDVAKSRDCQSFYAGGGQQVRSRFFQDYVLARCGNRFRWWLNGDEMRGVDFPANAVRGFSIMTNAPGVTVSDYEAVKGRLPEGWTCKNFVINGGFEELSDSYPVGWSTSTFGLNSLEDMADMEAARQRFRIDGNAYEGRCCMRVERTKDGKVMPLWECWRNRPAKTEYTYSLWLKADRPNFHVRLLTSALPDTVVTVSTNWVRHAVRFTTTTGKQLRVGVLPQDAGVVWVDAVQLERGDRPTPFEARRFHDIDVPDDAPIVADHYLPNRYVPKTVKRLALPRTTRVDARRGSYRALGREFFPFGFGISGRFTGRADFVRMLDAMASYGFNYVELFENSFPPNADEVKAILDAAAKRDMTLGFYVNYDGKTGAVNMELVDRLVPVKDHPALLQVGLYDEVWGKFTDAVRMANLAKVRAKLGDVPIRFNEFDAGIVTHFDLSAADVASVDMYYVGRQDVSPLYYLLDMLRKDYPNRVIAYWPMATGRYTSDWMRDATPDEIEAQAYAGYCQEVFNISWWIGMPLGPSVCPAMARVKRELDAINPSRFLDGARANVTCASPGDRVKFTARTNGKVTTVIAFNASPSAVECTWTLPSAPERVEVLFEDRSPAVEGRRLVDRFAPHGRHVYRFTER